MIAGWYSLAQIMTDHKSLVNYDFSEYLYFTYSGVKSKMIAFVSCWSARIAKVFPVPIAP